MEVLRNSAFYGFEFYVLEIYILKWAHLLLIRNFCLNRFFP